MYKYLSSITDNTATFFLTSNQQIHLAILQIYLKNIIWLLKIYLNHLKIVGIQFFAANYHIITFKHFNHHEGSTLRIVAINATDKVTSQCQQNY